VGVLGVPKCSQAANDPAALTASIIQALPLAVLTINGTSPKSFGFYSSVATINGSKILEDSTAASEDHLSISDAYINHVMSDYD